MLIGATSESAGTGVAGAIRGAARATGASFEYLLATARVESGLNPRAGARTSSARGLFQFVEGTWLATLKEAGPALGYGQFSNAITRTANGRYVVADRAMREKILALRDDPTANAAMAGAFTRGNAERLEGKIGRPASEGELYIAHFLGAHGAAKLINLASSNGGSSAANAFPSAARANRSIFYNRQGGAKSVNEVYASLIQRYDTARADASNTIATFGLQAMPKVAASNVVAPVAPANAPAVIAQSFAQPAQAASQQPMFHTMFNSENRAGAVSSVVRELWATRPHVAAALTRLPDPATSSTTGLPPVQPTTAAADVREQNTAVPRHRFSRSLARS
jgi:hypothetical protein